MKRLAATALALAAVVGCAKESPEDVASDVAVQFAQSQITRTIGSEWEDLDEVGVYMYKEAATASNGYSLARENVLHTTDTNGDFTASEVIYYPQSDAVDFYAYYPYTSDTGELCSVDITGQNLSDGGFDQGAIDFMTAALTGRKKSDGVLTFDFEHRLALVTFIITPKSSITTLRGVEISIAGVKTVANFSKFTGLMDSASASLGTGAQIEFETAETTLDGEDNVTVLTATAIMLPMTITTAEAEITFKINDLESHTASFPVDAVLTAGKNHTYNITIGYDGPSFGTATVTGWGESTLPDSGVFDAEEL